GRSRTRVRHVGLLRGPHAGDRHRVAGGARRGRARATRARGITGRPGAHGGARGLEESAVTALGSRLTPAGRRMAVAVGVVVLLVAALLVWGIAVAWRFFSQTP